MKTNSRTIAGQQKAQKIREKLDHHIVKNLGFKKCSFSDGSEYWFEKSYKFPVFGRIRTTVDTENRIMTMEVKSKLTEYNNYGYDELAMIDYKIKNTKDIDKILRQVK